MAILADILSGAADGSQSVRVRLNQADGAVILVYRGNVQLGSGVIANGLADVALSVPLVQGDIIQASVGERGTQAGLPVKTVPATVRVTGWKTPTEIEVIDLVSGDASLYPADLFYNTFGYLPASIYDPSGTRAIVYPEYEPEEIGSIQFSLQVDNRPGQTVVSIQNVTGQKGTVVTKWAGSESYGTDLSRAFTTSQTITISVKGSNDTTPVTRTVVLSVIATSTPSTPSISDIIAFSYRVFSSDSGPGLLRAEVNSTKQCQSRLSGWDNTWVDGSFVASDCQEMFLGSAPSGVYTLQVRISGDAEPTRWKSATVNKTN